MSKLEKLVEKMRNNSCDWRIEDIKRLADQYNINYLQPGTSHVTFRYKDMTKLTIPAHRPIKPIYIKKFLEFLDLVEANNERT